MADLVRPTANHDASMDDENELGEGDAQLLHEAGVLHRSSKGKRKSASKHVIFVDDVDSGQHPALRQIGDS
jgi:hypothetical protein